MVLFDFSMRQRRAGACSAIGLALTFQDNHNPVVENHFAHNRGNRDGVDLGDEPADVTLECRFQHRR